MQLLKGREEAGCFKMFPKKATAWYKEKTMKAGGGVTGITRPGKAGS